MTGAALVDLHTHSQASDGLFAPEEVVARAASRGLQAIALTDHDSVAGLKRARAAGEAHGIVVVPGVEFSCELTPEGSGREAHLLGLFIQPEHAADAFHRLSRQRRERFSQMLARLEELGLPPVELPSPAANGPNAPAFADGGDGDNTGNGEANAEGVDAGEGAFGVWGRPHLARAMVARGIVRTVGEAFSRYLRDGGPLDVPKIRMSLEDAVSLVHRMGGLAILAHPGLGGGGRGLMDWLEQAWPASLPDGHGPFGLDGVEAYHSKHSGELTARLLRFAGARGAAVSGGSDFHGPGEGAELGRPPVPRDVYDRLLERVEKVPKESVGLQG